MRTVELVAAAGLDDAVRDAWRRLAAAGLPSLADHPHPSNRPHLTLVTVDGFPAGAEGRLRTALATLPVAVRLHGLIFFGGRLRMAAWRVVPDDALLGLHAEVWRAVDGAVRNPLHAPGRWRPHVSLARRVRPEHHAAVAAVCGDRAVPGRLVAARSYDGDSRTVIDLSG